MQPLTELSPAAWTDGPTLADVMPSAMSALGFGGPRALPIPDSGTVVVLMIDGLGDLLLHEHAAFAPTLVNHRAMTMCAGFPSTTAASLTSLGTGLASGRHGVLGYAFAPRDLDPAVAHTLNALRWTLDRADGPSADDIFSPTDIQPNPTALDGLIRAGGQVLTLMPVAFRGSGLTRAAYGDAAEFLGAADLSEVRDGLRELLAGHRRDPKLIGPRLIYAYVAELDGAGHVWGPGSPEWCERLRDVDDLVRVVIDALGPDTTLVVTGDHGMITAGSRIDIDGSPVLNRDVRAIAGEARMRHIYAEPGMASDVATAWRTELGDRACVVLRQEVLDEQWFGADPAAHVVHRIGDVVAVPREDVLLTRSVAEPFETAMPGHHGGRTAAELLVPVIVATA